MITAINFPPADTILLDGNRTPITITSTNGLGFYFRAKIYINNILFDEQGWSRKDNYTATKDLIYLYHAYFKPFFLGNFFTGLLEQSNFKKKVTIVIEEYQIDSDILVDSLTLPEFYILYNVKSQQFNSNDKLKILGLKAETYRIKNKGIIVIPFYVNAENENVSVIIKDNFNNILHQQEIASISGKKIYIYTLKLEEVTLLSIADYITASISCGSEIISKNFIIIKLPDYEIKEIVYQNNFGFYIPAYFDGDFEDISGFAVQSYEQYDSSFAIYAIEEEATYTINTGHLTVLEKEVVNEVANSIDCYFNNGFSYTNIISNIKKTTNLKSRLNNYSNDLQFKVKKGLPFNNENLTGNIGGDPITLNLILENATIINQYDDISECQLDFSSEFPVFQLFFQFRPSSSYEWTFPILLEGITSPQIAIIYSLTNFQIRILSYYNGIPIFSNIKTVS